METLKLSRDTTLLEILIISALDLDKFIQNYELTQ